MGIRWRWTNRAPRWGDVQRRLPLDMGCGRCSDPPLGRAVRDSRLARLEAVLLLANEPLPLRKISRFASLADATEARTLTRRLNQLYDSQGTAFRVEEVAGGFQLLSRQGLEPG